MAAGPTPHDTPEPRQRVLDGEQRRLGERRVGERGVRVRAGREQAAPGGRRPARSEQPSAHSSTAAAKTGSCAVQLGAHAGVLRALPGEQERHRRCAGRRLGLVRRRGGRRSAAAASASSGRPPRPRGAVSAGRPTRSVCGHVGQVARRGARVRCVGQPRPRPRRAPPRSVADSLQQVPRPGRRLAGRRAPAPPRGSTCALVPPMPNELTPPPGAASRCGSHLVSAVVDVERAGREVDAPGSASRKLRLGGIRPCSMASTVLISPTTPAAWLEVADVGLHRTDAAPAPVGRCPGRTPRSARRPRSGRRARCPVPCAST